MTEFGSFDFDEFEKGFRNFAKSPAAQEVLNPDARNPEKEAITEIVDRLKDFGIDDIRFSHEMIDDDQTRTPGAHALYFQILLSALIDQKNTFTRWKEDEDSFTHEAYKALQNSNKEAVALMEIIGAGSAWHEVANKVLDGAYIDLAALEDNPEEFDYFTRAYEQPTPTFEADTGFSQLTAQVHEVLTKNIIDDEDLISSIPYLSLEFAVLPRLVGPDATNRISEISLRVDEIVRDNGITSDVASDIKKAISD